MSRYEPFLWRAVRVLAALWVVLAVVAVALRIGFPLELEWMEGGSLHHAALLRAGRGPYPAPSADFVPFLYTPLYPAILAGLGTVFPLELPLGRAVSVVGWVAVAIGLGRALRREGRGAGEGLVAAGLLCAGYVFGFRWLDLARADAVFLAFLVWGLVLLRESWGDHRRAALAGLLVAAAFWTKQTAFPFVVAAGVLALVVAPRQAPTFAAVIALVDGVGLWWLDAAEEGRAWTYIFELHQQHAFNAERFRSKTWFMFLHAAPFATVHVALAAAGWFGEAWRRSARVIDASTRAARRQARRGLVYWGGVLATALFVSALGYSTQWAEPNAFLPGVVFGALFVVLLVPVEVGPTRALALALVGAQLLFAAVWEPVYSIVQREGLGALARSYRWQDPFRTVPSAEQRARAASLRAELESGAGEVFALQRPWWNVLSGGPGHVGAMGVSDVGAQARLAIQAELRSRISQGRYASLWFEGEPPEWLRAAVARGYRLQVRAEGDERVLPLSGWMSAAGMVEPWTGPQLAFVPIGPRPPPEGVQLVLDFETGSLAGLERSGGAFGDRPVAAITGSLPAVAGQGGAFYLSSAGAAGRVAATGEATSAVIEVAPGGELVVWLGRTGPSDGLRAEVVGATSGEVLGRLAFPERAYQLAPARWRTEQGAGVRLRLSDDDRQAALFADDVWIVPPGVGSTLGGESPRE